MIIQSVRADTGGREGKWIASIITLILAFAAVTIPYHQAEVATEAVLEHQILVTDVEQENLAMLAELRLAHEEIRDLYSDNEGQWPTVEFLKEEWVAPFVEDQSWKRKGSHQWLVNEQGFYFAVPRNEGFADSFIMNANSVSPQIWIHFNGAADMPKQFDIDALEGQGWKMVVTESEAAEHHDDATH